MAAAGYEDARFDTVISCELHVELTYAPNLLASHIRKLRAIAVSLPISQIITGISAEAAKEGLDINCDRTEFGPTAFVQVPRKHTRHAYSPIHH